MNYTQNLPKVRWRMTKFFKGGFFKGKEKVEVEEKTNTQVLAVWGSPNCGKTTVAVKIAKQLALSKKNVVLVLCDMTAPTMPCICPLDDLEGDHSLRNILSASHISESLIKNNCNTHKSLKHLTVIGMRKGENEYSCPDFTPSLVTEFVERLRGIAPYIIIDCGSHIAYDVLSAVSIMESDTVLRLTSCDLKSISYLSSQLPLLKGNQWDIDKQYKVASNIKPHDASEQMAQVMGTMVYQIPHSQEVQLQAMGGNLFGDLTQKDSRGFSREIEKIVKEVFG